jgi:hypothetical protein
MYNRNYGGFDHLRIHSELLKFPRIRASVSDSDKHADL